MKTNSVREKIIKGLAIAEELDPDGQICSVNDKLLILHPDFAVPQEMQEELRLLGFTFNCDDGWGIYV